MGALLQTFLEDRSKLVFEFYKGNQKIIRILDFWENIKINESQKPNFISYNPISRAGSLYSYGGAKSRAFALSFNMTVANIQRVSQVMSNLPPKFEPREFFEESVTEHRESADTFTGRSGLNAVVRYDTEMLRLVSVYDPAMAETMGIEADSTVIPTGGSPGDPDYAETLHETYNLSEQKQEEGAQRVKLLSMIMWWVNLVRASVVNNAQVPLWGPPIVRIRHGIMYQDVPCVCTGYGLSWDESGGYDLKTLMPLVIKVEMKLEEYRNYGNYKYKSGGGTQSHKDALAGWESVITSPYTMDPGVANLGWTEREIPPGTPPPV